MRVCGLLISLLLALALRAFASPFRIFSQRRLQLPSTLEMNCYEVPMKVTALSPAKVKSEAWRNQKRVQKVAASSTAQPVDVTGAPLNTHEIQRRFDHLFAEGEDIVKEHAKLVQDINSLRQLVFVAPLVDEARDYDDSVYHEVIETASSTTTQRPTAPPPPLRTSAKPGFPILLLGGASQRQSVKTRPVSLVGSSTTPLVRHPYPFVGQHGAVKPYKVCMPNMPMYTTTQRPSLWNRLLSLFPRLTG